MGSGATAPRLLSRPLPGLAVAAYLSCFALAPASAAAATAKRDKPRPASSGATAPQSSSPESAVEHGGAVAGCCAAAASPPPAAAKKHHEQPAANGSAPQPHSPAARQRSEQGPAVEGSRPSAGAKRHHGGGDAAGGRSSHRTAGAGHGEEEGAGGQQAPGAAGHEAQALSTPTASRRQRERQRGKGKRGKGREERKEEGRGKRAPEPVAGTPKPNPLPLATGSSAARLTTAAPTLTAAAPGAATPSSTVGRAQSAGSGPSRRAAQRRAAGQTPASSAAASTTAPTALAAGALAAPTAAIRVEPARAARRGAPVQRTPSPLVTTVTRIINVVPPLVRILIGALVALALVLGVSSRLIALRARRLARQRRQLLDDVGLLQGALLPVLAGRLGPVGTSAAYRPASGPAAGGDFYDVFALADGQLAVIVGDVSGHGREALPHTTLVRFTLRAYLEAGLSPRGALQTAAPVLERQLGGSFATVVLATYHPRDRVLSYACAGHPPPIVIGGAHAITPITACSSPPIGAGEPTGWRQTVVSVPGGALACFFTDGVVEARVQGELFGADRLQRMLAELQPDASASALLDRVAAASDRRPDDMAACLLRIDGNCGTPSVQVEELELDRCEAARDRVERFLLAGGVDPERIGEVSSAVRGAVERNGGVVLELHLGDGSPKVVFRQQNVTRLAPPERATARAAGALR